MSLLAVSDPHGDLVAIERLLDRLPADGLLCCGDWGDPGVLDLTGLRRLAERLPIVTAFGNHDDIAALRDVRGADGTPLLLETGAVRALGPYRIGAINGIWAQSNREPFYITDGQVADAAEQIAAAGSPLDLLLTHGCPVGLADLTVADRHGGQRCFLDALLRIRPRLHLCGHLHRLQEQRTRDGLHVVNLGAVSKGDYCRIFCDGETLSVEVGNLGISG